MKFHHDFHHQAYINNLNKAMAGKPDATLVSLMKGAKAAKLNNAGGGHYNHCLFWTTMGKDCGGAPSGELAAKIDAAFGSFDDFKTQFGTAAAGDSSAAPGELCPPSTHRGVNGGTLTR